MSQSASPRRRNLFVALFALAVIGIVAVALWRLDDGDAEPTATRAETSTSTTSPTSEATTVTPSTPAPATSPSCEGPNTQFNVAGVKQDSLLPDCGVAPVTVQEEKASGLGLACGGEYPVIIFKTTTSDAKTSICARNASGVNVRFVTRPRGGEAIDLPADYDWKTDSWVAKKDGTKYAVLAYNGSLVVTKDGDKATHRSEDWITLDNESDYD